MMKRLYLINFLFLLLACSKGGSSPALTDPELKTINKTDLKESTTLCGLITDQNGNPVERIAVSDGYSSVVTDKNGVYQIIRHKKAKFVYYSTPSGYKVNVDSDNYPVFYEALSNNERVIRKDFKLTSQAVEETFSLLCVADPQCRNAKEVSRYKTETMPDVDALAATLANPYAITLGDIVFDAPELWGDMKQAMSKRKAPFFQVIGNHDHLETAANDEKTVENYQKYFGPTDYSFNRGKTHVVAMDNILYTGKQAYTGGFTDAQIQWLEQDLSHVPKDYTVILACHIPFRNGSTNNHEAYYNETLKLLANFSQAFIVTGHTHYPDKYTHTVNGKKIYEYVHGAACGAWWNSNICSDGTPNGYGVFEIQGGTIKNAYYKSTKFDKGYQIRAYDAAQAFGPANKYTYIFGAAVNLNLTGDGWIVANIWNADADWQVELFQDGKSLGSMTKVSTRDYWATYYHLEQLNKAKGSTFDKSNAHFYIGKLSGKATEANFEIVAKDKYGNTYRTSSLQKDFSGIASY
jgi:predicted phosphodiesterase